MVEFILSKKIKTILKTNPIFTNPKIASQYALFINPKAAKSASLVKNLPNKLTTTIIKNKSDCKRS